MRRIAFPIGILVVTVCITGCTRQSQRRPSKSDWSTHAAPTTTATPAPALVPATSNEAERVTSTAQIASSTTVPSSTTNAAEDNTEAGVDPALQAFEGNDYQAPSGQASTAVSFVRALITTDTQMATDLTDRSATSSLAPWVEFFAAMPSARVVDSTNMSTAGGRSLVAVSIASQPAADGTPNEPIAVVVELRQFSASGWLVLAMSFA